MADIVNFPKSPVGPRLACSTSLHDVRDQCEFQAAIRHMTDAGQMLLSAAFAPSADKETLIAASAEGIEAALFHLLTLKGGNKADLPLRRLLAERDIERSRR
ncbi:hypothetical protein [Rhizobium sp. Nf11,1]|uniref:hypothetical protein n=1 Tax=Rhizobium sp. Nf11,1 TaxID=3404923 RepID=UPI003D359386